MRARLREAFEIEKRLPGSKRNFSAWPFPVIYSFADLVGRAAMGEPVRLTGATPAEISRMDEALAWFKILQHHPEERKYLAAWAACSGSVRAMVAGRGLPRATFYRRVIDGSDRIARALNAKSLEVR